MSRENGTSPIIAGLLIVPIVILVNSLDLNESPRSLPTYDYGPPAQILESSIYTEPKTELSSENLQAAFPSFSESSVAVQDVGGVTFEVKPSDPDSDRDQEYIGTLGCGENGSCYGDLNASGVPKEVFVRGYYRSDGTYVRSHYRSRPNQ